MTWLNADMTMNQVCNLVTMDIQEKESKVVQAEVEILTPCTRSVFLLKRMKVHLLRIVGAIVLLCSKRH